MSTRKVKAVTEELCGHAFSVSTVSTMNARLDEELARFAGRRLEVEYPCLILDARYEKVRLDGVIRSQTVLVAIGINWEGRREVLGVELAGRESQSSWRDFLVGLRQRGLRGVELAITDDHSGLKKAVAEVFPEEAWQRCYVHFLRNALDYLPRKADDDCLMELRWLYDRRSLEEARRNLNAWLSKGSCSGTAPALVSSPMKTTHPRIQYRNVMLASLSSRAGTASTVMICGNHNKPEEVTCQEK